MNGADSPKVGSGGRESRIRRCRTATQEPPAASSLPGDGRHRRLRNREN